VAVSGLAVFVPLGVMTWIGVSPFDVYGLLGTLATFGFLTAYMLVSVAAPIFLRNEGKLTLKDIAISVLALAAMTLALLGNVYPAPPPPYTYLPYIYLVLLVLGLSWSLVMNARAASGSEISQGPPAGSAAVAE
jgi:amino acid transporter